MFDLHVDLRLTFHLISNNFQISNFGPRLEYDAGGRTYHSVKWKQEPVLRQVTGLEVKLVWHRNNIEKIKWIPHRYFVSFENRIKLSSFPHQNPFHLDLPFTIYTMSTDFRCRISILNGLRIKEVAWGLHIAWKY